VPQASESPCSHTAKKENVARRKRAKVFRLSQHAAASRQGKTLELSKRQASKNPARRAISKKAKNSPR
jgi:hypothetical protein